MKKKITLILSVILLSLVTHVKAEQTMASEINDLDNSFTTTSDTVGWTVTGDGLDASSNYNWTWYKYGNKYMKSGRSYSPYTSFTYTLTSPEIILSNRGADLTFNYVKAASGSTFMVYVLHQGTRHLLLGNLLPTGSSSTWFGAEASLSAYAGDTIHLVFEHTTIQNSVYLDDVKLEEPPLCPTAKHLTLTALQTTSATFSWDNSTSDRYVMLLSSAPQLDPSAVTPSEVLFQDTIIATTNGNAGWTYTKDNLLEGTPYYLYLKSDCSATMQGYGTWSEVFNFQTPCSAQPVPYAMDFEAISLGETPSCWISESSYETPPSVIDPLSGDAVNSTKVFDIANNMNSECMLVLPLFSGDVKDLMMSMKAKTDEENISFQIGLTNDLSDAQSIVTLFNQTITNAWNTYTFFFDNSFTTAGSNYYIVLYMSSGKTESMDDFHVYLDDISVENAPSCLYPLQFEISAISDQTCTLAWVDKNTSVTDYTIEYTAEGGTPQTVNTTTNPYTLTGLSQDTEYTLRVRNNCNATDHSEYTPLQTIHTTKSPILVTADEAGVEDFERMGHTFTLLESESNNQWAVGTALSNSPTHAMYISGNQGTTYGTLSSSKNSYAYAYADVSIPLAGDYNISFSWKGLSYSANYSYMELFLTTPDKEIELNSAWSTTEEGTTLVGSKFRAPEQSDWEKVKYRVNIPTAGLHRLVFFRKTYSSSRYVGDYSAVDDIKIKYIACDEPTSLAQTSTSTASIGLSWTSTASNFTVKAFTAPMDLDSIETTSILPVATVSSTSPAVDILGLSPASIYYIYVQAQCDATHRSDWVGPLVAITDCNTKDLPYAYDFNNDIDGTMPLCWLGTPNKSMVETSPSSTYSIDNTPVLYFVGGSWDYAILPQFNTPMTKSILEFDYKSRSSRYSGNIVVGYITNPSDISTFVGVDTFASSPYVTHVVSTFETVDAAITGRLVIVEKAGSSTSSNYGGAIDNIQVYETPTCWPIIGFDTPSNTTTSGFTLHWNPSPDTPSRQFTVEYGRTGFLPGSSDGTLINVTDTFCTISGLESSTLYDVYVSTNCGGSSGTSTAVMGSFKTLITPADGTDYSCDFEDDTENTLWTMAGAEGRNSWEIGTQSAYEGSKGLYVVNSSGQLGYDGATDHCWAYRNLHCTIGLYTVTIDYKCQGNTNYDYMNCVVIPEMYNPEGGNSAGITKSSIPEGWFTGDPLKMNQQDLWTSYTFQFPVNEEGDITLAFHWANNSYNYYDPASVDNITVKRVNCRPAYKLNLSSLSQTTANLTWSSDSYDHFEVILDTITHTPKHLDTLGSATFIHRNVTAESINITGLQAAKTYYAYVRNHCTDTTEAEWSEVYPFTTLCTIKTLPFTEDFEQNAVNDMPLCWTYFSGDDVSVRDILAFSDSKALYLQTAEASSIKLALPMVNMPLAIENYQLVFYAYRMASDDPSDLVIALNSAEDVSSTELNSIKMEPITIPASQEGQWRRIVVPFEHPTDIMTGQPITMGDDQIVFITIPGPTSLYIDAVTIEEIPACPEPYDVAITSIGAREIYYSWDGSATNYEIQCLSTDGMETLTRTVSGDTAIFSGLRPHTTYNIQIRSLCSANETSTWSQLLSFTTECAKEPLPYLEDFSTITTGENPICWEAMDNSYYDHWASLNNGTESYMYLKTSSHSSIYDFALTTTEIDLRTASYGTMSFDVKGTDYAATPASLYILDLSTGVTDTLMTSILFTSTWTNFEVDIQAHIGHIVRFRFEVQSVSRTEGEIYFDNIRVEDRLYVTPPTGLRISAPSTNSVVVHLNTDPAATGHNIAVVPENSTFDPSTAPLTPMTLPDSVLVTGLRSNTYYKVYAQALNGSYESKWVGVAHFNTSCAPLTLPLIEDFETSINGVPTLPLCWTTEGSVSASQVYSASGQGSVKLSSSAQYITSEITDELNTAEVYFNGYATTGTPIIVSVCTDPLDLSTKMAVDTITVLEDYSKVLNVDFRTVPAGYHYVVFENNGTSAIYLDNIILRTYAPCRFPETFTIGHIEKGRANILISGDATGSTYDIYYGLAQDVDIHNLTATVSQVSDSSWITGLGSHLSYAVFIRKNCGTSQGQWVGPLNFTSACTARTITDNNPYLEDFSTLTATTYDLPECWSAIHNTGTSTAPYIQQYYSMSTYSPSYVQAEAGRHDSLYIILPEFTNALNTLRWEFDLRPESGSSYTSEDHCMVLGSMSDPSDESTFVAFSSLILEGLDNYSFNSFDVDLRYIDIPTDHHYLAYRISDSNNYFRITAIKVSNNDDCAAPHIAIVQVQNTAVTVGLNPIVTSTSLELVLRNESGTYNDTILGLASNLKSYTFTALTPGNLYYIKARSSCGETMSDWSESIVCMTPHEAVATYPYYCNFEEATENEQWNHPNGGLSNQWMIGSDPNGRMEGTAGLYLSDDKATAGYDMTQYTFTWASRALHLVPGSYQISFMAKAGGQTSTDVMRAFMVDSRYQLLPCNYYTSTLDDFDNTAMTSTTDHEGFIDLLGDRHYISSSDWALYTFNIVVTDTMDSQLAFLWRSDSSNGSQPGACIDSISIINDDCPAPRWVDFVKLKSDHVVLRGHDLLEMDTVTLHYACVLRDSTFNALNTIATASNLSGETVTLSGLTGMTLYDLYIARSCSDGSTGAWSEPIPFETTVTLGTVPYFCGFEPSETESRSWSFYNDANNAWIIDTMAPLTDDYSLYISNDNTHPTYSIYPTQYSYAVRSFHFEPGLYDLSFSWECAGEGNYDYLMVALTPDTFLPIGGNSDLNGKALSHEMSTPAGSQLWGRYNLQPTPQIAQETINIPVACDMNLIFAWTNDGGGGTNPGAIVDDISITKQSCGVPLDLHTENLTATSTTIAWTNSALSTHLTIRETGVVRAIADTTVTDTFFSLNGLTAASNYTCEAYSICSATDTSSVSDVLSFTTPCAIYTLPFDETFEQSVSIPKCWQGTRGRANLDGNTPSSALSGTSSDWIHSTLSSAPSPNQRLNINGTNGKDWIITPLIALAENATLSFDLALTDWNNWNVPENETGVDDKFAVMISRDYGSTWQTLSVWESSSELGHKFYDIPNTYETQVITIPSSPDHAPIQIAFYGESTETNGDNDIHIDNIHMNCLSSETLVLYDTICQGYAYGRNGFSIPANLVTTGTYTQLISGESNTCDQMKELHLFVNPRYDVTENATICKGQSYPFGPANLTEGGDYINTLSTVEGCDSVVHLNLTVTQLIVNIDTMICEGDYFAFAGEQRTVSGLYSDTTRNAEGCDSVTNLNLNVLPSTTTMDSTICEGDAVTVGSTVYTSSGTYINTLKNVLDCDSTVTLNLTVIPSDTVYTEQICSNSSYNFRGTVLYTPGFYTDTVHNYMNSGCDYVYKLTLNETLPDTVEISDQFCEGMSSYYQHGFSIDDPEEKDYSITKTSEVTGCDSVTILHLSMINTVYGSTTQTICDNESYNFGGKEYYAAGTYTHTFASTETGCDSIVTLTLMVNPTYTVDVNDTITVEELPYTNLTLVVPVGTEVGKYDYTIESATEAGCDSTIYLTLTITKGDGLTNVNVGTLDFYPNVVKGGDNVTITTDFSESERQEMSIRLYDATGKLIATYQPQSAGTMSYTMPSVSGMYYLRLETKSGQTFSGKLIIL